MRTSPLSSSRTALRAFLALVSLRPVSTRMKWSSAARTPMLTPPGKTQMQSANCTRLPKRSPFAPRIRPGGGTILAVGRATGGRADNSNEARGRSRSIRPAVDRAALRRHRHDAVAAEIGGAVGRLHTGDDFLRTFDQNPAVVRNGNVQAGRERDLYGERARILLRHQR